MEAMRADIIAQAEARRAEHEARQPPPKDTGRGSRRGGRPRHVPTKEQRQLVAVLAATQTPLATIAMLLQISLDTLKVAYAVEIETGYERVTANIKGAVTRKAISGDIPAVKVWARMWGGLEWARLDSMLIPGTDQAPAVPVIPGESVVIVLPHNGRDLPPVIDGKPEADDDADG